MPRTVQWSGSIDEIVYIPNCETGDIPNCGTEAGRQMVYNQRFNMGTRYSILNGGGEPESILEHHEYEFDRVLLFRTRKQTLFYFARNIKELQYRNFVSLALVRPLTGQCQSVIV